MADILVFRAAQGGGQPPRELKSGDGGGTSGGMESRMTAVEVHIEHIRKDLSDLKTDVRDHRKDTTADFRILFGAIIVAALGLAGLMAKGFHWF
jgi:hypothetical protein